MSGSTKSHIISINSKDNITSNNSDAVYSFRQIDLQECIGVKLKDVAITNLIYNIENKVNDVLDYDFNGTAKSITIPQGAYDASTLLTTINGLQTDLVFGININTQKYTVTSASNSFLKASSTIKKVLGFTLDTTPSTSYELPFPFDFIRTHYINILSNLSDSNACYSSSGQMHNLIAQIPVVLPFGYILSRQEENTSADHHIFLQNVNLTDIKIKICDDDFKELNLNGGDYVMSFVIYKR